MYCDRPLPLLLLLPVLELIGMRCPQVPSLLLLVPWPMLVTPVLAWVVSRRNQHQHHHHQQQQRRRHQRSQHHVLSDAYLENDLVAVRQASQQARLCAVRYDGTVAPLCIRSDDVETDLFVDPREYAAKFWTSEIDLTDDCITGTYGEGFYGQRPVPSLGGGPGKSREERKESKATTKTHAESNTTLTTLGYGAEADDCWSVDEEVLERVRQDGVLLPELDMGISHGEKARAGAF